MQVGYMVAACLLNETNEVLRLVINSVRNDIIGRNETAQCLALTMVANVGGKEFAESLAPDVMKLLVSVSDSIGSYTGCTVFDIAATLTLRSAVFSVNTATRSTACS